VTDLAATSSFTAGALTLSLTAPGDDAMTGTAKSYELRWSLERAGRGVIRSQVSLRSLVSHPRCESASLLVYRWTASPARWRG